MNRFALFFLFVAAAAAQTQGHQHQHPSPTGAAPSSHQAHQHGGMTNAGNGAAVDFLLGQSSGTAFQPSAWPMPMVMNSLGQWRLMWMGQAFVVNTQQSGPRGGDKTYSPNWGMLGAARQVGRGAFLFRIMPTLEPLTVTHRSYPLLFQTGEAAFGRPLVDGQHPHELVMELSAQYARPIGESGMWNIYYAPVGDPALGPVAFPHRASALELPQATLAHHWQDATHIANNVLTAGIGTKMLRVEASGFHGREPNENRWNIDWGRMDSWSGRVSLFASPNWMGQVSVGRLASPEQFHEGDVVRMTASVEHVVPRPGRNWMATSFIWGRNYKTAERRATNAVVAETLIPVTRNNLITGRFEWSQRDELFENDHHAGEHLQEETGKSAFNVTGFTAGYTREIGSISSMRTGIGANFTLYSMDSLLKPYYGSHPRAVSFFLRFRLQPGD